MRAGIRGIIITAAFIGPGTVTTATMVGAQTGYALIWLLIFAVFATFTLQEMASRLGTVSGIGLSEAIMQGINIPAIKIFIAGLVIIAIGIGNAAYEGGNITGAALGLSASFGGNIEFWTILLGGSAFILIASGHYNVVEKCLVILVALMSLVFIGLMLVVGINFSLLLKGLLLEQSIASNTALALAIIGTTIVPYNLFLHAGLSAQDSQQKNKQYGGNFMISDQELRKQNKQLFVSIGIGGLVTLAILSSSVSAFFATQITVDKSNIASQMAPLLGENASLFFGIGFFSAGLTSSITAPLAAAYAICGLFGWQTNLRHLPFKIIALIIVVVGTIAASIGLKPLALIMLAQTSNALLLPISAVLLVWVCNQKALLGDQVNSLRANIAAAIVISLVLVLATYKLIN